MARIYLLIKCILLTFSASNAEETYDLAEEAETQMQELLSTIRGQISVADNDIQSLYSDFQQFSRTERYNGQTAVQRQYLMIESQIRNLKSLAQTAGKDVSACTSDRETAIQDMSVNYTTQITTCVNSLLPEGIRITEDAKYFVDIIMNKAHSLENQLKNCGGDLLCISPLLTQIELYRISLVQDIRTEVVAAEELLTTLKLSVTACADEGVSSYGMKANSKFAEIKECVDETLG